MNEIFPQFTNFLQDLINRLQTISLSNFTMFDLAVVVIFIALLARGAWTGVVRQLAAFAALVGGYLVAARYAVELRPFTSQFLENPKVAFFAAFGIMFMLAALVFTLAGHLVHKLTKWVMLEWLDRFLGLLLGAIKAYLVCSFVFMVLAADDSPFQDILKKSQTASFLTPGAELVCRIINDPKLREHFKPQKKQTEQVSGQSADQGAYPGPAPNQGGYYDPAPDRGGYPGPAPGPGRYDSR